MARLSLGAMEVSWAALRGMTWKFRQIKEDGAFLCYWEWTHKSGSQRMAGDSKSWVDNQTLSLSLTVHCCPNHCDRAGQTTSSHLPNPPAASNQGSCRQNHHFALWGLEELHLKPRKHSRTDMYSTWSQTPANLASFPRWKPSRKWSSDGRTPDHLLEGGRLKWAQWLPPIPDKWLSKPGN